MNAEKFEQNGLNWGELTEIYNDYLSIRHLLNNIALTITAIIRENEEVHSVRSRVKDPEHLIEKIIRKTIQKKEEMSVVDYKITKENYTTLITDLIGIRVLHLYKEQAILIDEVIRNNWEPYETPTVYKREGGEELKYVVNNIDQFDPKIHPAGYRSWHYLIKQNVTKLETIAEVQVRTIFEEGWSEIDHQLRYPYQLDNELLNGQLLVLNRLAGSADEMVNSIINTLENTGKLEGEKHKQENIIAELNKEIEDLSKSSELQEKDMKSLQGKLKRLEESQTVTFSINDTANVDYSSVYYRAGGNYNKLSLNEHGIGLNASLHTKDISFLDKKKT
ncbi:hypothetical protein IFR10_00165 [Bacillus sp. CFBP 13597]|nr:hypothetical protein [Bacillus sp. CFBP 13597]